MSGETSLWIWDTMLSMTLLMALVLLIRKPVAHFFGPHIAYLLWVLPVARLFMPTLTVEAPAPVEAALPALPMAVSPEVLAATPVEPSAFAALAALDWTMIALIIWLGGAGLLFISKLAAYLQFREDIVADGRLIGRHGKIRILETAAVSGPLAFGLYEKYIAVPTNFFRDYAPQERELALEHEIAHHESGDLIANFAGLVILSLHWFNPVAWFSWVAFRQDQETACDARVLDQSGRDARAVYGRTIAKSVSGHRLGLASPLNQKDKIKGRLKMLGQEEKSGFRRKMGMALVGASTVVSLPLTATVVYAEADVGAEAHDPAGHDDDVHVEKDMKVIIEEDGKKKNVVKIRKYKGDKDGKSRIEINPGKDGHVRTIEKDGKKIVIRTDKPVSDEEFELMIKEAEKEAREARKEMREHKREMEEHRREMRIEMREVEREVQEELSNVRSKVNRDLQAAWGDMEKARHEARQAMRDAWQAQWKAGRQAPDAKPAPRAAGISRISFQAVRGPDCKAMNKQIAMGGRNGLQDQAWAVVAGCGKFEVKIDRKQLLKTTLDGLKKGRAEAAKCKENMAERARRLDTFDRNIEEVKRQLSTIT